MRIIAQNRRGKGNALACGFAAATGDIIVMVDADGSADPAEIFDYLSELRPWSLDLILPHATYDHLPGGAEPGLAGRDVIGAARLVV